jgi:hypothetical protein
MRRRFVDKIAREDTLGAKCGFPDCPSGEWRSKDSAGALISIGVVLYKHRRQDVADLRDLTCPRCFLC